MLRSRASTAWFLFWAASLLLAFRPVAAVERATDLALAPLRLIAELAAPFAALRPGSVEAAEQALAANARAEADEGQAALAALARRALPVDAALVAGRRFVHGELVERPDKDHGWVAVPDARGIEKGCPVVCGDAYVGRVLELAPGARLDAPARVRIELVTAKDFRVGAVVAGAPEDVFLVVGGLYSRARPKRERVVRLAAHQPSSPALAGGLARVNELLAGTGELAQLGQGFRLGEVQREGERGPWWIAPELDYLDGLFQVAIVTRVDPSWPELAAPEHALEDGAWLATRALSPGDPSPWRSTVKIPRGSEAGVRVGAAVIGAGARLLGRVLHAGAGWSDVAWLSDPGFTLTAIARVAGEEEPRILGRLTTIGREEDGAVRLRWSVRVPLVGEAGGARPARLFSGSGDPGLPAGLYLGEAELPAAVRAGEECELVLRTGLEPADVRDLFVRLAGAEARP